MNKKTNKKNLELLYFYTRFTNGLVTWSLLGTNLPQNTVKQAGTHIQTLNLEQFVETLTF